MSSPEYRKAERDAFCRACDKTIQKGEYMVSWYSHRNQGMNIHICPTCAIDIGTLVEDKSNE